ncbi:MAG: tetratricopeptide repeat protein [Candidatus Paceibacterota bacterium]|jgi:tetratricopeptide (TPR) repeat protein
MPPQQSASQRRSFDSLSIWALLGTIVIALIIVVPSVSTPLVATKSFLLAAGAIITLALYILARLTRGNIIFPSTILVGALWLPVIAYALSSVFSGVPFMNSLWGTALEMDTLGLMLIVTVLGTIAALLLRRSEHYQSFLRVGAYSFVAVALFEVLVIAIGQFSPSTVSPSFSILGSIQDAASFLGLGVIAVLITLRLLEPGELTRRVLIVSSVLALFLLAVANSSLVWTLLALVSLGLFVEAVMRRGGTAIDTDLEEVTVMDENPLDTEEGNHSLILPLAVLAVSLFFLIGGALGSALANGLGVSQLNVRPSWQSTFSIAQKVYTTSPVFGSGPNTFGVEWLKHRDAGLNSTVFWNVDFSSGIGFIPTSIVTTGIVGAFAWIAFLGLFIVIGLRMLLLRSPRDAFVRYVAIVSFVVALYLFAIALFDLPSPALLALAFVFAGVFISTTRFALDGRQWGVMFSRSPRLGFVIVFSLTIILLSSVVAAYALVGHYIAVSDIAGATKAFSTGDIDNADKLAQRAISFAPSSSAYQVQAGIANARLSSIAASSTMEKTAAQQAYQDALSAGINAAMTATNLDPSNYQNWLALGNLYAQAVPLGVSSAYESARTAYQKAQALNPTNPQILYILAQLDIANKDTKAAQEDLKSAIALKQDYTQAIFLLSQLEVQDGNVKDALASALSAAYFTPNDPNILFQVGVLYAAQSDFTNAVTALSAAVTTNPKFANARYFLSAVYAKQGDFPSALVQMKAIAEMSAENAKAVASQIAALESGTNPFPSDLLSASSTTVQQ